MPRPAQVRLHGALNGSEIRSSCDPAVVDGDPGVLVRVGPTLSGQGIGLVGWVSWVYVTVLEYHGCVAKNEINRAVYVTFPVELSLGVYVESILIALEAALVKYREVRPGAKGHGLVVLGPGSVPEGNATSNESVSHSSCNIT